MIERTACLISSGKKIDRNQAIEAYLMNHLPDHTALLFLCENEKAVLQGCKEDTQEACRSDLLLEEGGVLARRISGGKARFFSEGILSYSFLVPKEDFSIPLQLGVIAEAVHSFGIQCFCGNDASLYAAEGAFCDSSFYKSGNAALHHGSIYCDGDLGQMALYLNGFEGGRVVNLSMLNPQLTLENMEEALFDSFGMSYGRQPVWLDERLLDEKEFSALEERFRKKTWVTSETISEALRIAERFPWGGISVYLQEKDGMIQKIKIFTDAAEAAWFDVLEQTLLGAPFLIGAITDRIREKYAALRDPRLQQLTMDFNRLLCGHIRQIHRSKNETDISQR